MMRHRRPRVRISDNRLAHRITRNREYLSVSNINLMYLISDFSLFSFPPLRSPVSLSDVSLSFYFPLFNRAYISIPSRSLTKSRYFFNVISELENLSRVATATINLAAVRSRASRYFALHDMTFGCTGDRCR